MGLIFPVRILTRLWLCTTSSLLVSDREPELQGEEVIAQRQAAHQRHGWGISTPRCSHLSCLLGILTSSLLLPRTVLAVTSRGALLLVPTSLPAAICQLRNLAAACSPADQRQLFCPYLWKDSSLTINTSSLGAQTPVLTRSVGSRQRVGSLSHFTEEAWGTEKSRSSQVLSLLTLDGAEFIDRLSAVYHRGFQSMFTPWQRL